MLVRHEQGAVHAAEGFARSTGKVGVAMVTSGPGATNTITGLANAYMDSTPIVVISGQVATHLIGNDAFQEADVVGITRPCTKYNYLVRDVNELATIVKEAFYLARSGRPGPVLIDLPKDVSAQSCIFSYPDKIDLPSYKPSTRGHPMQVRRAVELMQKTEKAVLYVGGGVVASNGADELLELAEKLNLPVTPTLMGLGCFPSGHRQSLGMLGMHGTYTANMAMAKADLIVSIGARFDDRVTGKLDRVRQERNHRARRRRPGQRQQERPGRRPHRGRRAHRDEADARGPARRARPRAGRMVEDPGRVAARFPSRVPPDPGLDHAASADASSSRG